jgi:hypothetical protein
LLIVPPQKRTKVDDKEDEDVSESVGRHGKFTGMNFQDHPAAKVMLNL